jgi:hypothetical protein
MRKLSLVATIALLVSPLLAQGKYLWVLRAPGEMVEYDPATFAVKQTVKVPPEAVRSPDSVQLNRPGEILFAPAVSLPLAERDVASPHKAWIWNGHAATTIDLGLKRETAATGSNQAVTESAPAAYLSTDGGHLYWFANHARRLQREDVDLSITTTWQAWQSDLNGAGRRDIATVNLPDCRCSSGACEETCPSGVVWVPDGGVDKFFVMTQFFEGQTEVVFKASTRYREEAGKWTADALTDPLQRVLDATSDGNVIVEAIPDSGCCGWSNESNDQTVVRKGDKRLTIFDEFATYRNSDYDVSFYTGNARLSPDLSLVAMTIVATAEPNEPIQLSDQGQANPEESKEIRKALAELPAVEIKSLDESRRRIAFVPHATLVGWVSEKEILIVEDHLLVAYNVSTGTRRMSTIRVEDAAHVFLR